MTNPKVAQNQPYTLRAQAGKRYAWCSCGESKNQPLCDGSHTGTPFTPVIFTAEHTGTTTLCGCKATKKPPFCDGSHSQL